MQRSISERILIMERNPYSTVSEAYRLLRTNLEFCSPDHPLKSVVITSSVAQEGRTTTAINLAVAFAHKELNVLLIDADLRNPVIHKLFNKHNRGGLTTVLAKQSSIADMVQDTSIANLSVLTAGPISPNPSEMLSAIRMTELMEELKAVYDMIILDTPPVSHVTDAAVVAAKSDGVLLVASAGKVKKQAILKAKAALNHVQANLLGVVLNDVKPKRSKGRNTYEAVES